MKIAAGILVLIVIVVVVNAVLQQGNRPALAVLQGGGTLGAKEVSGVRWR